MLTENEWCEMQGEIATCIMYGDDFDEWQLTQQIQWEGESYADDYDLPWDEYINRAAIAV